MKRKKVETGKTGTSGDSDSPWPEEKDLAPIGERLSDPNYVGGSLALDPNASETDRAKFEIFRMILGYKLDHGLLQKRYR